ncbi:MAG: hypothetical protein LBI39_01310 [Puniceicoccales bacterium]|jgi:hypothetical protein|nr:hypothetical protein [Puniceicoccales bacterium]
MFGSSIRTGGPFPDQVYQRLDDGLFLADSGETPPPVGILAKSLSESIRDKFSALGAAMASSPAFLALKNILSPLGEAIGQFFAPLKLKFLEWYFGKNDDAVDMEIETPQLNEDEIVLQKAQEAMDSLQDVLQGIINGDSSADIGKAIALMLNISASDNALSKDKLDFSPFKAGSAMWVALMYNVVLADPRAYRLYNDLIGAYDGFKSAVYVNEYLDAYVRENGKTPDFIFEFAELEMKQSLASCGNTFYNIAVEYALAGGKSDFKWLVDSFLNGPNETFRSIGAAALAMLPDEEIEKSREKIVRAFAANDDEKTAKALLQKLKNVASSGNGECANAALATIGELVATKKFTLLVSFAIHELRALSPKMLSVLFRQIAKDDSLHIIDECIDGTGEKSDALRRMWNETLNGRKAVEGFDFREMRLFSANERNIAPDGTPANLARIAIETAIRKGNFMAVIECIFSPNEAIRKVAYEIAGNLVVENFADHCDKLIEFAIGENDTPSEAAGKFMNFLVKHGSKAMESVKATPFGVRNPREEHIKSFVGKLIGRVHQNAKFAEFFIGIFGDLLSAGRAKYPGDTDVAKLSFWLQDIEEEIIPGLTSYNLIEKMKRDSGLTDIVLLAINAIKDEKKKSYVTKKIALAIASEESNLIALKGTVGGDDASRKNWNALLSNGLSGEAYRTLVAMYSIDQTPSVQSGKTAVLGKVVGALNAFAKAFTRNVDGK